MNRFFPCGLLFLLFAINLVSAQSKTPDWVHTQYPSPKDNTYFFQVFSFDHEPSIEELGKCVVDAGIARKRNWYDVISKQRQKDEQFVGYKQMCPPYVEENYNTKTYYYLFAISQGGDVPTFQACDCNSTTIQDSILNAAKELRQRAIRKIKAAAIPASVFVPGVGQMVKGQYVKGGLMLGGEVIGVGGIIASFAMKSSNETLIINDPKHQTEYAQRANSWQNVGYGFIGLAAAVYLYSLIDVIAARPTDEAINKKIESLAFTPIYSPIDNSLGIAMSINF